MHDLALSHAMRLVNKKAPKSSYTARYLMSLEVLDLINKFIVSELMSMLREQERSVLVNKINSGAIEDDVISFLQEQNVDTNRATLRALTKLEVFYLGSEQ